MTPQPLLATRDDLLSSGPTAARAERDAAQLVRGIASNDPAAIVQLWDEFSPLVRRIAARSLGRSSEIDDVVQDIFLRLYRGIPRLREPDALKGFVIAVTTRRISTEITRRRLRRWLLLTPAGILPERATLPDDGRGQEAVRHMLGILELLDDRDRLAFVLRYVEELELSEVARLLGRSLATVKRRLVRATALVQAALRRDESLCDFLGIHDSSRSKRHE